MNKKLIITLITIIIILIAGITVGVFFSDSFNSYPVNIGEVSASGSELVLKYNNAKCSLYTYTDYETQKTQTLYYNNKILNGEVKIDLSKITWSDEYESDSNDNLIKNKSYKTDAKYAKEHFLTDIKTDFDSNLNKTCNIEYYDKNNIIPVDDNSVNKTDNIVKNMSLNGDILTIKLHKNYQLNTTTPIQGDKPYKGILVYGNQTEINRINTAKLTLTFYNNNYYYKINVKLDKFKINSTNV